MKFWAVIFAAVTLLMSSSNANAIIALPTDAQPGTFSEDNLSGPPYSVPGFSSVSFDGDSGTGLVGSPFGPEYNSGQTDFFDVGLGGSSPYVAGSLVYFDPFSGSLLIDDLSGSNIISLDIPTGQGIVEPTLEVTTSDGTMLPLTVGVPLHLSTATSSLLITGLDANADPSTITFGLGFDVTTGDQIIETSNVPEPGSLMLLSTGAAAFAGYSLRRRQPKMNPVA